MGVSLVDTAKGITVNQIFRVWFTDIDGGSAKCGPVSYITGDPIEVHSSSTCSPYSPLVLLYFMIVLTARASAMPEIYTVYFLVVVIFAC